MYELCGSNLKMHCELALSTFVVHMLSKSIPYICSKIKSIKSHRIISTFVEEFLARPKISTSNYPSTFVVQNQKDEIA